MRMSLFGLLVCAAFIAAWFPDALDRDWVGLLVVGFFAGFGAVFLVDFIDRIRIMRQPIYRPRRLEFWK